MPIDTQLTTLFCLIDDFCTDITQNVEQYMLTYGQTKRLRQSKIHASEVITLLLWFHLTGSRNFKAFYLYWAKPFLCSYFTNLPSYSRFIELKAKYAMYFVALIESLKVHSAGIAFIDSTKLAVCHNKRIHQHRVFADSASRGKTSVDWFYGFKLHLICDHIGRLVSYCITTGNVDDRKVLPDLIEHSKLKGKLFGDRGYVGKNWKSRLAEVGVQLITRVKRNMKPQVLAPFDHAVLKKRGIIEAPFKLMKSQFDLEHSRHRSKMGLLTTIFAALTLYALVLVNGYKSGIQQILKPIDLNSA
ncbi:transposase of ISAba6, IS982 family [Acinetobacter baumannii SDF]|uniref:Transposase of ISAba6, IS982 family n=1 Tax=Acinetobacter baumannii (strain SDF) TaxID=509170 RepID=B0VQ06_ACIBS|nr:transposase of ISAba6, IS982 family [Acinetobacter baumannii SDF]